MNKQYSSTPKSRHRGERAVLAVFPPSVNVIEPASDRENDLVVNGQTLNVKWVGQGHLGDIRAALDNRPECNAILVARQMSPGARATLAEAGVNWADESGAAEITIGTIVISRSGNPGKKDKTIKRWSPAVISVAEVLLCGARGTQSATQAATGLSAGSCANALRFLGEQALLTSKAKRGPASARRVTSPRELLDAYANEVNEQPSGIELQVGITWQDILSGIVELGRHFDSGETDWAVTGAAAAAVIAPYLSSIARATLYVDAKSIAELQALAVSVELRPIQAGRLTLKPFPTVSVQRLTKRTDDLRIAPWPRVYADLRSEGVRGEEAAEHLFEVIHGR
jgi:hypothetical protein